MTTQESTDEAEEPIFRLVENDKLELQSNPQIDNDSG